MVYNINLDKKPAISIKKGGKGAVVYVGTYLTETLLKALTPIFQEFNGLAPIFPNTPENVHVTVRQNEEKELWFISNDGDQAVMMRDMPEGINLLTGKATAPQTALKKRDVLIVKKQCE